MSSATFPPIVSEHLNILKRICKRGRSHFLKQSDNTGIDLFEHMETELGRLAVAIGLPVDFDLPPTEDSK